MEPPPIIPPACQTGLTTQPLGERDLAQAYALVALCEESVTLEAWRRHMTACGCPASVHWCAVRDPRGYMHGLFSHRVEHDLVAGPMLQVDDILAAGPRWQSALAAIERRALELAARQGCAGLRIRVDPGRKTPGPEALRRVFGGRGFVDRGSYLLRMLGETPA
jgi:hypothetical protein